MKIPFFKRKENTNAKPKRIRVHKVEITPNEARIQRNKEYRERIRKSTVRRSYGKK